MSGAESLLYVYGVGSSAAAPDAAARVDNGLIAIVSEPVAAFARWASSAEVVPSEDALWRHEAMCEALMEHGPLLPARFGTTFANEGDVMLALRAREDALSDALARVANRVELGIRAVLVERADAGTSASGDTASPGRAYLERRRALEQERSAAAATIHAALAPLAADSTRRQVATPYGVLTASYLVDRADMGTFRREVEALEAGLPAVRIVCTGPWPPYSFVNGEPVG